MSVDTVATMESMDTRPFLQAMYLLAMTIVGLARMASNRMHMALRMAWVAWVVWVAWVARLAVTWVL